MKTPVDHIDVRNIITIMELHPEQRTTLVREMIRQIESLKADNAALIDEIHRMREDIDAIATMTAAALSSDEVLTKD